MSVLPAPACPACHAELSLQADDALHAWACPDGHGLAFTLSEAYERLQEDEIHEIWQRARSATAGERVCPMCPTTMVSVAVAPDADEAPNGNDTRGGAVSLDVCLADEVFWFDAGELDEFPQDLSDPEPSAAAQAGLATVTKKFGDALSAGWDAEERTTLTGRLAALLTRSGTSARA